MSVRFTLTGETSILSADFNPPIFLDEGDYVLGLLNFESYNSIPNVTKINGSFHLKGRKPIKLPEGAYEIKEINEYIQTQLNSAEKEFVEIRANNSTMKTLIKSTKQIDFTPKDSIGKLLGFESKKYNPNEWHLSEHVAKIIAVNSLLIYCNISAASYKNGKPTHIIHQFFPRVPPGFKIVECPNPVVYLPANTKQITNITVKILDQDENLVSFHGETITVGLHLKKL